MRRINIGVIGCGLIAQVMHLPHLRELREQFNLCALCDLSAEVLARVADDYAVTATFTDYHDLLALRELDAVLIASSGDHSPSVLAALEAGKHVFVEKPLSYGLQAADRLIETSERRGLCLMVGYMKWFDPAFETMVHRVRADDRARLIQLTTVLTPEAPYYRHHRLHRQPLAVSIVERLQAERAATLAAELPDLPPALREVYVDMLIDSAIHDVYVLRGLAGDPVELVQASMWADGKAFHFGWRFSNNLHAHFDLLALDDPGGRYEELITCYTPSQRLHLDFPSPYLRNAPTKLTVETLQDNRPVQIIHDSTYDEAFKLELLHFYSCMINGTTPRSSGREGRKEIALLQQAMRACLS